MKIVDEFLQAITVCCLCAANGGIKSNQQAQMNASDRHVLH